MTEKNNGLNHKIARIMGRLDRLPKSGTNKHFKYKFVTESDVADMIRAELATENIAFFASMVDAVQNAQHTVAKFEFTFVCADTAESKVLTWYGEANDGQDKGISKAATSAEKFFLLKTFICSTGDPTDDPDSDGRTPELRQNAKTTPPAHDSGASSVTIPEDAEPSELDAHFGPRMTPAQILAGDTFPFEATWKTKSFATLRDKVPGWNSPFWAAVGALELDDGEVHDVAGVESMNDYAGHIGSFWLALCEYKLATDEETE